MNLYRRVASAFEDLLRSSPSGPDTWYVLVTDAATAAVLDHLFKAPDFLRLNIALLIDIATPRQPIPDATALYLVQPSESSVRRCFVDICNNLYRSYELVFTSASADTLGIVADVFRQSKRAAASLARVAECPLSMVFLNDVCFSLSLPARPSAGAAPGGAAPAEVDPSVLNSDLHISQTACGVYGYILALNGAAQAMGAAEEIVLQVPSLYTAGARARLIADRVFDLIEKCPLKLRWRVMQGSALLLVDREVDVLGAFRHRFSYGGLLHELNFADRDNRFLALADQKKTSLYGKYLFTAQDSLYLKVWSLPFNEAVGRIRAAVQDYKANYDSVSSSALSDVVDRLSNITKLKKECDVHTDIASDMITQVGARSLHKLVSLEMGLPVSTRADALTQLSLFARWHGGDKNGPRPPECDVATVEDAVRLGLMVILSSETLVRAVYQSGSLEAVQSEDLRTVVSVLGQVTSHSADDVYGRLRTIVSAIAKSCAVYEEQPGEKADPASRRSTGASSRASGSFAVSAGQDEESAGILTGVISNTFTMIKKGILRDQQLPLSKVAANLVFNGRSAVRHAPNGCVPHPRSEPVFGACSQFCVFVSGGGNINEAQEIAKAIADEGDASQHRAPSIVYGCDFVSHPLDFLLQNGFVN